MKLIPNLKMLLIVQAGETNPLYLGLLLLLIQPGSSLIKWSMWTLMVTSSPLERYEATSGTVSPSGVTYFKWIKRLICFASSPYTSSTPPLIKTPLRFSPAREISIITEACGLALKFLYLWV